MTLRACDLPDDLKKGLLAKVREQIGETEYRKLLDALGPDGIIDAILAQGQGPAPPAKPPKKTMRQKLGGVFTTILASAGGMLVFIGFMASLSDFKHWYCKIFAGLLLLPYLIFFIGFNISEYPGWAILTIIAAAGLVIWGLIQGLILAF
jgi:hypothetical protein